MADDEVVRRKLQELSATMGSRQLSLFSNLAPAMDPIRAQAAEMLLVADLLLESVRTKLKASTGAQASNPEPMRPTLEDGRPTRGPTRTMVVLEHLEAITYCEVCEKQFVVTGEVRHAGSRMEPKVYVPARPVCDCMLKAFSEAVAERSAPPTEGTVRLVRKLEEDE